MAVLPMRFTHHSMPSGGMRLPSRGGIVSRAQLEDRLYGGGEQIDSHAISVFIHQLRRKLGDDFIQTVRGVGYYVGTPRAG